VLVNDDEGNVAKVLEAEPFATTAKSTVRLILPPFYVMTATLGPHHVPFAHREVMPWTTMATTMVSMTADSFVLFINV
jgi:hypothetical protein